VSITDLAYNAQELLGKFEHRDSSRSDPALAGWQSVTMAPSIDRDRYAILFTRSLAKTESEHVSSICQALFHCG